jgi:hypothetical protein
MVRRETARPTDRGDGVGAATGSGTAFDPYVHNPAHSYWFRPGAAPLLPCGPARSRAEH